MKKWGKIRLILGALAAAAAAVAAVSPPGLVTIILVGAAAGLGGLVTNLPSDVWTAEELANKKKKKPEAAEVTSDK